MSGTSKGGGLGPDDHVAVLAEALLSEDRAGAEAILRERAPLAEAVLDGLIVPALQLIGAGSAQGEVSLDRLYLASRMCGGIAQQLALGQALRPEQPRIAIGVLEDCHLFGSQIVQAVLAAAGYEVTDWGARLSVADVVARVEAEGTQILLVSVLMLRAALRVADLSRALASNGSDATLVVGGAPFRIDPDLAAEVGVQFVAREATDVLAIIADMGGRSGLPSESGGVGKGCCHA